MYCQVIPYSRKPPITLDSFPQVLDWDGTVTSRYRVQALPTTFILDRHGMIRSVIVGGPLSEATLTSKIDGLLAEDASP